MDKTTRVRAFLFGCIPTRLALTWLAAAHPSWLPYMAVPGALIALGFALIYLFGLRPTGVETGGAPIWWNSLRPLHALLYAAFTVLAWRRSSVAWTPLAADTAVGLVAFAHHHLLTA